MAVLHSLVLLKPPIIGNALMPGRERIKCESSVSKRYTCTQCRVSIVQDASRSKRIIMRMQPALQQACMAFVSRCSRQTVSRSGHSRACANLTFLCKLICVCWPCRVVRPGAFSARPGRLRHQRYRWSCRRNPSTRLKHAPNKKAG